MARANEGNEQLFCSFCGKRQRQVKKLIAGPGVYICDECIDLCNEIIDEELTAPDRTSTSTICRGRARSTPSSTTTSSARKRRSGRCPSRSTTTTSASHGTGRHRRRAAEVEHPAARPTGCGKTLLAQTLARILNVPFAIADATALTEAGYVGEDVENILLKLIQAADFDIKKAETGIIYIDEVDKIARKADNPSITRDVSGEGVQQALLKILEGTVASVPPQGGRKHPHQEFLTIDTTNILFICGGAFAGLDKIIERRIGHNAVGFGAEVRSKPDREAAELLSQVMPEDLDQLRPHPRVHRPAAGRLGGAPAAPRGSRPDPRRAEERARAPVPAVLRLRHVELVFTDDALWEIAEKALARETGARGLRSIIESALLDVMFELPSRGDVYKCVMTRETI